MMHQQAERRRQKAEGRQLPSAFCLLLSAFCLLCTGCSRQPRVVLYCAQDREFAEQILADFTGQTGVPVVPRYDSEANKAVGLFEDLVREAPRPRCDVHWNNEILATIRLQRQGILEPYQSPSAAPYPSALRAKDHTWTGFAARARVLIVNTKRLRERDIPQAQWPRSLLDLTAPRWKDQLAMAKPVAGTSATQAACLFQVWGKDKARTWYLQLKANGVQLVAGNKQVAEGVGQGQYLFGLTDTDDAIAEVEAGRPIRIVFLDADASPDSKLGTLYIPNTVAVIRSCPNPEGARRLVDYLLSAEVESKLAESASKQIPQNPKVRAKLPPQIQTPQTARALPVDFERAAELWDEVQSFMTKEFLVP
jgi:iron(III) transport system substrate-binding protein